MPRVFHPGHRPNQPLYPDELVYTTIQKVSEFLQLPLPDPVTLAGDTTTALGAAIDASLETTPVDTTYILIPIGGADYRRWGFAIGDSVTVYDNVESMGSTLTLKFIKSSETGRITLTKPPEWRGGHVWFQMNIRISPLSSHTDEDTTLTTLVLYISKTGPYNVF
jgi:hypothetical protein